MKDALEEPGEDNRLVIGRRMAVQGRSRGVIRERAKSEISAW